jgi:hypothetical protein
MPDIRSKALGYLRAGKVVILRASPAEDRLMAVVVVAVVIGHHGRYAVDLEDWRWRCTPPGRPRPDCQAAECAHVAAVKLVSGWPSLADKPVPAQGRRAA